MNRLLANLMRDVPISRKLMLLIMLTCGVTLVTVSLIFVASELITIRKEQREDLASLADIVAKNTSSALIFGDPEAARETMSTLSERSDIMAAYLLDVDGRIFARYIAPEKATESLPLERRASGSAPVVAATLRAIQAEGDRLFSMAGFGSLVRPISNNGQPLGTVVLHSDMSRFLQHLISAPILALAKMMRDVSHAKNFALRAMRTSNDEIGLLFDGFNEMLYEIEERNETLRMRQSTCSSSRTTRPLSPPSLPWPTA